MNNQNRSGSAEHGGAGVKMLLIAMVLIVLANAGYHYIPVAYEGASFQQEMDTAVVKGLAASGQMKPLDVVKAHLQNAAKNNNLPPDAVIDIRPSGKVISATATYAKKVDMLPFGLYKYNYQFNYTAVPTGYLTTDDK